MSAGTNVKLLKHSTCLNVTWPFHACQNVHLFDSTAASGANRRRSGRSPCECTLHCLCRQQPHMWPSAAERGRRSLQAPEESSDWPGLFDIRWDWGFPQWTKVIVGIGIKLPYTHLSVSSRRRWLCEPRRCINDSAALRVQHLHVGAPQVHGSGEGFHVRASFSQSRAQIADRHK